MEEWLKEISGDDAIESTKSKVFYGQESINHESVRKNLFENCG